VTTDTNVVANHPDAPKTENAPFTPSLKALVEERKPTALPLVYFPDSKLLEVSKPVTFNPYQNSDPADPGIWVHGLKFVTDDMVATMQGNNGVGLSAIQVGLAARIIVVAGKEEKDAPIVMVNPQWRPADPSTSLMNEGCLSFPAVFEDVERFNSVECQWYDVNGKVESGTFYGVQAQVIQHECEHLDGHLLIEHLPTHKRDKVRLKMKQRARLTSKIDKLMRKGGGSLQGLIDAGLVRGATSRPGFRSGR
jgi:peptide deformylase